MGNSSSSNNGDGGSTGSGSGGTEQPPRRTSLRPGLTSRGLSHRIVGGGSNNNAHNGVSSMRLPSPFRIGGSLGLSRSELDARCQPSGLYPTCEWETKQIRRLISNGQLASRLKGSDTRLTKTDRECPICFMYYSESNVSKCCNATLCTECYLQIKPQKEKTTTCPFCNNPKMVVLVQSVASSSDVAKREEEEQRVIEATIKSRISELNGESPARSTHNGEGDGRESGSDGFGSSLQNYNRNRTRTASDASSSNISTIDNNEHPSTPNRQINPTGSNESDDASALQSLAMSPADRRNLENEMRAQLSHDTHLRTEREAEEARMRHAQEWYGSNAGIRSRVREARLSELTSLLERMGARGGGLLGGAGGGLGAGGIGANNNNEDEGEGSLMAGAGEGVGLRGGGPRGGASLSRLLRAMETSNTISSNLAASGITSGSSTRSSNLEDLMRLEAAFFLGMDGGGDDTAAPAAARARRGGGRGTTSGRIARNTESNNNSDNNNNDEGEAAGAGPFGMGGRPAGSSFGGSSSRGRLVRGRLGSNRGAGVSSTHLDTAELLMRGVSEEDQLAMAIAMSMQDAQQQTTQSSSSQQGAAEGGGTQQATTSRQTSSAVVEGRQSSNSRENESEEEADDSSSASSSSSGSSEEETEDEEANNNEGGNIDDNNGGGAVSLDEDEEEVVFSDVAEV